MKQVLPRLLPPSVLIYAVAVMLLAGCKGGKVPGATSSAPHLEDRDAAGNYTPYYQTGEMHQPRYLHEVVRLKNGQILATGGSDERGFSALDTAEIFDETQITKGELKPPTGTGVWFDTDFEGNPMTMGFQRFWHTMTILPDNSVLVVGGGPNWLKSRPVEKVEIFDPDTRLFTTLKDAKLLVPRVRHTTSSLPDGTLVVSGGQFHDLLLDIQQAGSNLGGTVQFTTQTDIYPSTPRVEVFNFRDLTFTELKLPDSPRTSGLSSSRGRAGHVSVQFAGPDNLLNSGDDLLLLIGGFQTPAAPQLVPQNLLPRQVAALSLRNLEVYDPTIHVFSQIGTVLLEGPRVNDPQGVNLGIFNERTPDDVLGLGNVVLICNGDDNDQNCPTTTDVDELLTATFTGFGPAQGLTFHKISGINGANEDSHRQAIEWEVFAKKQQAATGRAYTNIVAVPRSIETRPGQLGMGTWVFNGVGQASVPTPAGCFVRMDLQLASGTIFDPEYPLIPDADFSLVPKPSARDLKTTRDANLNPTGVVGTWLTLDGKLPTTDRIGFADIDPGIWPSSKAHRIYPRLITVAGEDGIINTPDDRVLFTGGGQSALDFGGEVTAPSAEVLLLPKSQ